MALRELLQDVFAGIALNIDRTVRIGEYIQIHKAGDAKISGQVLEISWRTTRIKDFMGDVVIFPNSKFSLFTITNFSQPEPVSFRSVSVVLDARVSLNRATRILQAAALEAMMRLAGPAIPAPWVEVKAIKLEGVEYAIYFKAEFRHLGNASPQILQNVLVHLAHAGLEPATSRVESGGSSAANIASPPSAGHLAALIGAAGPFRNLPESDLSLLSRHVKLREQPQDSIVVQAGEAGTAFYLVLEGLLSAEAPRRIAGRSTLAPVLRPGDLFDASVALLGEAHTSTVRARTSVLLCEFDQKALQCLFTASPAALVQASRYLAALYPSQGNAEDDERAADILRQMRHLFPAMSTAGKAMA
jgi:CRP-like cAMP-binding protein